MTILTTGAMAQENHVPSHPDEVQVYFSPGEFNSSLKAAKVETYVLCIYAGS